MHFVDDEDFGAGHHRAIARRFDDLANIINAGMRGRVHFDHINMARFNDGLTMHTHFRHMNGGLGDSGLIATGGQFIIESPRKNARRCGFANPAHAGQNIGLMNAAKRKGIAQSAHHGLLADEIIKIGGTIFARQHTIGHSTRALWRGAQIQPQ